MIRRVNKILQARSQRRLAFGTFIQLNSPETCEIAASSGMDFVIIDMEHGAFGIEAAVNLIRAAESGGATPVVRIDQYSRASVLKVLDAGAVGVIVPNVESAQQLQDVVSATRYAPAGTRGACPCVRVADHGLIDWAQHVRWCEQNVMVIALVETEQGVTNFEEIIGVEGLAAVAIGQFDLSVSMGLAGAHDHPDVLSKQADMLSHAKRRGVGVLGVVFETDPEQAEQGVNRWRQLGADMVAVSGDRFALTSAFGALKRQFGY